MKYPTGLLLTEQIYLALSSGDSKAACQHQLDSDEDFMADGVTTVGTYIEEIMSQNRKPENISVLLLL